MAKTVNLYVNDYNALLPHSVIYTWTDQLAGYGNSEKIRHCPETVLSNDTPGSPGRADLPWSRSTAAVAEREGTR